MAGMAEPSVIRLLCDVTPADDGAAGGTALRDALGGTR
ncbi:hypothetical protein FHS38_001044 [Streptomyces netropsis]|uniref:Uncharacterized protein n=1 Tax=Streptomyces netropsis TaxID=55404 RepID=A0A7W7L8I4_STRNE|nr:hypothetical protein [Streptomyces netropsis]